MSNNNSDKDNPIKKSSSNLGTVVSVYTPKNKEDVNEENPNKEGSLYEGDTIEENGNSYIKNLDKDLEELFKKTHDLEVGGKLKNLDNNTSRTQKANEVYAREKKLDEYLNKLQNCNRDANFDNNNQENISIENSIRKKFDIDKVKNSVSLYRYNKKKNGRINDKNFSNTYLKAEYNRFNTYPKDKYTDPKAEYNNTEPKAKYNNTDQKANTEPKAKYDQLWNNFNNLLELKSSVNSNADKKGSSKGGFGCFGNCCNC